MGLEGLLAATDLTDNEAYRQFAYGLVCGWMARSTPPQRYDFTAPGLAMVELLRYFDDVELRARLLDLAAWQGRLTRAGGQVLVDPLDTFWVWVDCMQFQGPFFAALGSLVSDEFWYREADRFLLAHAEVLRDGNGLYSQVYDVVSRETNAIHWGRGQGWAMLGLWQTWLHLPDSWPARPRYAELLRDLLDTILAYQTDSGHWRTIIDDPSAQEESSVAAFYVATAVPAFRAGLLGKTHAQAIKHAWKAVYAATDTDGLLRNVSADTLPGTPEEYKRVPAGVDVPWGQGPLLLALSAKADELPETPGAQSEDGHRAYPARLTN